ncbi:altronate dehydratase family protein, partial [Halomonas sp. BBD48]|nr:altronate dehydratase family protein [Halomonas sp. BBD48]
MQLIHHSPAVIRLHANDNVGVATRALAESTPVDDAGHLARQNVDAGHKVALIDIASGEDIVKYGQVIGRASRDIALGEHVHTHNVAMLERDTSLEGFRAASPTPVIASDRTFNGYHRADGQVGTRNYIGILSTVNCSATVAKVAAETLNASEEIRQLGYDGVVPVTHGSGCAMNSESEGFAFLERVIAGYARHPNFAFVLIIGLGCETNQVKQLVEKSGLSDSSRIRYFNIQDA